MNSTTTAYGENAPTVTELEFSNAFIEAGCTGMSVAQIARAILQKFDVRHKKPLVLDEGEANK